MLKGRYVVREVEHRTFSGAHAFARGQPVLYITERCVFTLTADGLELSEVAPGIDVQRDILAKMDFEPIVRGELPLMAESKSYFVEQIASEIEIDGGVTTHGESTDLWMQPCAGSSCVLAFLRSCVDPGHF